MTTTTIDRSTRRLATGPMVFAPAAGCGGGGGESTAAETGGTKVPNQDTGETVETRAELRI